MSSVVFKLVMLETGGIKPSPTSIWGEVDIGKGNPLEWNWDFLDSTKNLPTLPDFEKVIALAFLKGKYPILSAFHLQGPKSSIYLSICVCTSFQLVKKHLTGIHSGSEIVN